VLIYGNATYQRYADRAAADGLFEWLDSANSVLSWVAWMMGLSRQVLGTTERRRASMIGRVKRLDRGGMKFCWYLRGDNGEETR